MNKYEKLINKNKQNVVPHKEGVVSMKVESLNSVRIKFKCIKSFCTFYLLFFTIILNGQSLSGTLTLLTNQEIKLEGFQGLKSYAISSSKIDEKGNFTLNYSKNDRGIGYLLSADNKPLFVILSGEDIELVGEALSKVETLKVTKGKENQWFEKYANEHPKREQALSAWQYLEKMYTTDELFKKNKNAFKFIQKEKTRVNLEDKNFLESLPKDSYVSWFLPIRKLLSSVSNVAQFRPEEISSTLQKLRAINYSDSRLYKSGLFKDAIDNHVWFIENTSGPIDTMFANMNKSIDQMLATLVSDEKKYNEVTDHLFNLLEKRSLFTSSEHLALKVLQDNSCTLNDSLSMQLESYRIMKKGNIAPDIVFSPTTYYPDHTSSMKLSELKSNYTLVVFAAGWCTHCQTEIPKITSLYEKWLSKGIEVVMVSLDDNITDFSKFAAPLPFISTTDLQKWESPMVKDYHVFGTPTMFLLDSQRKILLRPNSVNQVDAWVDWNLVDSRK